MSKSLLSCWQEKKKKKSFLSISNDTTDQRWGGNTWQKTLMLKWIINYEKEKYELYMKYNKDKTLQIKDNR